MIYNRRAKATNRFWGSEDSSNGEVGGTQGRNKQKDGYALGFVSITAFMISVVSFSFMDILFLSILHYHIIITSDLVLILVLYGILGN